MLDSLTPTPAPDFSHPLGLMRACHQKILDHCQQLIDLCDYLEKHSEDEAALQSCAKIYRYFNLSASAHHQDEEQDLFPLLLAQKNISNDTTSLIARLKLDHFNIDKIWLKLEPVLAHQDLITLAIMKNQAQALLQAYESHIELENNHLLPIAETSLESENLQQLGSNMKKRREEIFTVSSS